MQDRGFSFNTNLLYVYTMKISLILILSALMVSCEFQHDRVVEFTVTSIGFSPATTETPTGNPEQATGPITAANFSIQYYYEIKLGGEGDYIEDPIINMNRIDSFMVWSPQTFSGRAPYTSLNTLFSNYPDPYNSYSVYENGSLLIDPVFGFDNDVYHQTGYLVSTNAAIEPGTYDLYFRCKFHDGTQVLDSLINIEVQ